MHILESQLFPFLHNMHCTVHIMIISYFLIPYQLETHWCSILTAAQEQLYQSKNHIIDFYLLHLKDKSHATHGAAFDAIICNLVVTIMCVMYKLWIIFCCKWWQCGFSDVPLMVGVIEWNNLTEICVLGRIMCLVDGKYLGCGKLFVLANMLVCSVSFSRCDNCLAPPK